MTLEELKKLAEDAEFDFVQELNMDALVFMPEVRDMCGDGKCTAYGTRWTCPPACGSLDEMREKVKEFSYGILVQSVAQMEDEFDFETIQDCAQAHKKRFDKLTKEILEEGKPAMFMGTGGCTICAKCTYPDEPCRFPDRAFPSMEACGLLVSKVCTDSGLAYNHGQNTLAYTACVLI